MDTIKQYRKKPVVITAWQTSDSLDIKTLEGEMHASPGDWIITGVNGEQYPCKPDIFEKTYEPADLEPTPDARGLADPTPQDFADAEAVYKAIDYDDVDDYSGRVRTIYDDSAKVMAGIRARLLDEAVERGVAWLKTLHHEPEEGLPWSGKIRRMQDLQVQTLRAAIKGAAHE